VTVYEMSAGLEHHCREDSSHPKTG